MLVVFRKSIASLAGLFVIFKYCIIVKSLLKNPTGLTAVSIRKVCDFFFKKSGILKKMCDFFFKKSGILITLASSIIVTRSQ